MPGRVSEFENSGCEIESEREKESGFINLRNPNQHVRCASLLPGYTPDVPAIGSFPAARCKPILRASLCHPTREINEFAVYSTCHPIHKSRNSILRPPDSAGREMPHPGRGQLPAELLRTDIGPHAGEPTTTDTRERGSPQTPHQEADERVHGVGSGGAS